MGALRLLLALSVIAGHTSAIHWLPLANATAAVEIFFVISGFYMALILNEKYVGTGSYWIFIANRFTRIYPIYFAVTAVTAILALSLHTEIKLFDPERLAELATRAKTFIFSSNIAIFGLDSFDFLAIESRALVLAHDGATYPPLLDHMRLVPQAWSLGPELMFYLMAPLIVRKVPLLWVVGLTSLALRIVMWEFGFVGRVWSFEFFPTALVFFVLGALLYHAHRTQLFQRWAPVLAPFAVYATALGLFTYGGLPGALSWTLIIVSIPFLFYLTKHNPFDRLIGELSYPVYMIHFVIIFAAQGLAPDFERSGWFSSICAVLSIALGFVIYWRIALPIDRWRDRLTRDALQSAHEPARPAPAFEHSSAKTAA